jgi:hypothetical protein
MTALARPRRNCTVNYTIINSGEKGKCFRGDQYIAYAHSLFPLLKRFWLLLFMPFKAGERITRLYLAELLLTTVIYYA